MENTVIPTKKTKAEFYDLKLRKKVTCAVSEKSSNGNRRWFTALTKDGRKLTLLVGKEKWDAAK